MHWQQGFCLTCSDTLQKQKCEDGGMEPAAAVELLL